MPKTDTTASGPKKIVTLPAPVTTGTSTTGGGKIVTLPVGTVGKAGRLSRPNPDSKAKTTTR